MLGDAGVTDLYKFAGNQVWGGKTRSKPELYEGNFSVRKISGQAQGNKKRQVIVPLVVPYDDVVRIQGRGSSTSTYKLSL